MEMHPRARARARTHAVTCVHTGDIGAPRACARARAPISGNRSAGRAVPAIGAQAQSVQRSRFRAARPGRAPPTGRGDQLRHPPGPWTAVSKCERGMDGAGRPPRGSSSEARGRRSASGALVGCEWGRAFRPGGDQCQGDALAARNICTLGTPHGRATESTFVAARSARGDRFAESERRAARCAGVREHCSVCAPGQGSELKSAGSGCVSWILLHANGAMDGMAGHRELEDWKMWLLPTVRCDARSKSWQSPESLESPVSTVRGSWTPSGALWRRFECSELRLFHQMTAAHHVPEESWRDAGVSWLRALEQFRHAVNVVAGLFS